MENNKEYQRYLSYKKNRRDTSGINDIIARYAIMLTGYIDSKAGIMANNG